MFCSLTFHRPAALPLLRGTGGIRVSGTSWRRTRGASRGFWPPREPLDSTAGAIFLTIVCPLPPVLLLLRRGRRRERGNRERGTPRSPSWGGCRQLLIITAPLSPAGNSGGTASFTPLRSAGGQAEALIAHLCNPNYERDGRDVSAVRGQPAQAHHAEGVAGPAR